MKNDRYTKWVWQQEISPSARKFTYLAVANMADNSGICTASLKRISKATGICRRTLIIHLAALEKGGWLVSMSRYRASGRRGVNAYCLASSPRYHEFLYAKQASEQAEEVAA